MKRLIQFGFLVVMIVLLLAVFLPVDDTVFAKDSSKGSTIGGVDVTNVKHSALASTLQTAITDWLSTVVVVSDDKNTITLGASDLTFDIESAISQYETMTKKPWYAFWQKDKIVQIPLPVTVSEAAIAQIKAMATWDADQTLDTLITQASYLHKHEIEATTNDLDRQLEERIGFQIADIPAGAVGLQDAMATLNDAILVPNQPVSLLTLLGEQAEAVNQIGLNFLASMLYSTVLQTEYEILERHPQAEIPAYLQPGVEAAIDTILMKDLRFINVSEQPGKLNVTIEGNLLKIEIFSATKEKDIRIRVETDSTVNPRTIYRYSDELAIGQEMVLQEGKTGIRVKVYRLIVEEGASTEQLVSQDYYAPINQIVVRSTRQLATSGNTSETTEANDSDLKLDLDGNGLADRPGQTNDSSTNIQDEQQLNDPEIVYGYYDKGGNFVQTSP